MTDPTTAQMADGLLDEFVRRCCAELRQLNYGRATITIYRRSITRLRELMIEHRIALDALTPDVAAELATRRLARRRRPTVQHDYVVCLNCGYRGKTLRRHINVRHGLNRDEYLRRWGLKSDHPLTAPAYSERRSAMSKALGFGRRPATRVAQAGTSLMTSAPIETEAKPISRQRVRPASKSAAAETNPVAKARTR